MYFILEQNSESIKIKNKKILRSDLKKYKILDINSYNLNKNSLNFYTNDFENIIFNIGKDNFRKFVNIIYKQMRKENIELYKNLDNYKKIKLKDRTLESYIIENKKSKNSKFYKNIYLIHNSVKKNIPFNIILEKLNIFFDDYNENVKEFYVTNIFNNNQVSYDILENRKLKDVIIPYSLISNSFLNSEIIINKINSETIVLFNDFNKLIEFLTADLFYNYYNLYYFNKKILNFEKDYSKLIDINHNISIQK